MSNPGSFNRKVGRFSIDMELLRNNDVTVFTIFKDVIPVRAEAHFATNSIEYVALSPYYTDVEVGEIPPKYTCVLSSNVENEEVTVTWEKDE